METHHGDKFVWKIDKGNKNIDLDMQFSLWLKESRKDTLEELICGTDPSDMVSSSLMLGICNKALAFISSFCTAFEGN